MSHPVGRPITPPHHPLRPLLFFAVPAIALLAALALNLLGGGSAGAETVTYFPSSATCSNSTETDDTPAACSASAGTLTPGGGAAIVENDDAGATGGDDDLQMTFDLSGLDVSRMTGASLEIGASPNGSAGTIQLGGPSISDTNYGAVSTSGGTTSSGALVNAVAASAGGSITVWLQVACQSPSDDCGAAVDSVRLNVDLQDETPSVSLLVSDSSNRSGAQALAGSTLDGNAYVFINPDNGINQVRFYLDDPSRNSPVRVENAGPFDFGGTDGSGAAQPWNADSVADGSHTIAAEVDFNNGTSTVVSATFTTGSVAPTPTPSPGNPALLVSGSSNRSNSVALQGSSLTQTAYIHVSPGDNITRVRFYFDDPSRNNAVRVEAVPAFDFGGTAGNGAANPWNPGSVSSGAHTIAAEVDFNNGTTSVLSATFTTGGSSSPTPTPSATATPPPSSNYDVYVSTSSNRSNPAVLDGQTFDSNIYVFVLSGDNIQQARFWLDDRNRNGAADQVENLFPFDFAGGSASQAGGLNAGNLSEGTHWITVELDVSGSGMQVIEGSFDVPAGSGGGGTGGTGGGGVPIPSGAIRINPGQSIQSFVNGNPSGSVFVLGSGIHRQQTVVPKDNNVFIGETGTILNGSRVLTNWASAGGGQYYVTGQTQQVLPKGGCDILPDGSRDNRCQYAEQVFVNNVSLKQVLSRGEVNANTFYFDYGADRIYIGQNPSGKLIETSVNERAFTGGGSNVTVSGMVIEKYSTRAQDGAIHTGNGWTVSNNEVRLVHGYGIRAGANSRILNNYAHHNGQMGIGGSSDNVLLQGNEVAYNNTHGFLVDWEGGGIKFATSRNLVVRGNYVHNNIGRGIWTDLNVIDLLVEDNTVEWNDYEGIKHEISYAAVIRNNLSRFNGSFKHTQLWGAQILIQNSQNVEVYGNEVWVSSSGGDGIGIVSQNRGSGTYGPYIAQNNYVHHNEVHHQSTTGENGQASGDCSANNRFDYNTYYAPSAYFSQNRFEVCGLRTWSQMRAMGWETHGTAIGN